MNIGSRRRTATVLIASFSVAGLAGCGLIHDKRVPCCAEDTVKVTRGLEFDFTGSAQGTDLVQIAENRAMDEIQRIPTGEALVISGFTSDVTVACNVLKISIPDQNNPQQEQALRRQIDADFPARFKTYTDCLAEHGRQGRSEIFGGITDFLSRYPDVTRLLAITDGCENVAVPDLCRAAQLETDGNANQVVHVLPQALIPRLDQSIQIFYVGIGRGTGLPVPAVVGLRSVWSVWTTETGASFSFDAT